MSRKSKRSIGSELPTPLPTPPSEGSEGSEVRSEFWRSSTSYSWILSISSAQRRILGDRLSARSRILGDRSDRNSLKSLSECEQKRIVTISENANDNVKENVNNNARLNAKAEANAKESATNVL